MRTRRDFLGGVGAGLMATTLVRAGAGQEAARKRLAVVTTVWRYGSHAWHMAERFLVGYPVRGAWHQPGLEVVSAYVDQTPAGDLSRRRAAGVRLHDLSRRSPRRCGAVASGWPSMPC